MADYEQSSRWADPAQLFRAAFDMAAGGKDRAALTEQMLNEHYLRGLSHEQIARKHGMTRSAVTKRLNRVRSRLATYGVLPPRWT